MFEIQLEGRAGYYIIELTNTYAVCWAADRTTALRCSNCASNSCMSGEGSGSRGERSTGLGFTGSNCSERSLMIETNSLSSDSSSLQCSYRSVCVCVCV